MDEFNRISALPDLLENIELEREFIHIIGRIQSAPENKGADTLLSTLFELADRQWYTYLPLSENIRQQLDMLLLNIWSKESLASTEVLVGVIARLGLSGAFSELRLTSPDQLTDEVSTEIASAIVEFGDTVGDPYSGLK